MTNKFVADRNQVTGSGEQVTGNREPGTGSGERVRDNDPLFRGGIKGGERISKQENTSNTGWVALEQYCDRKTCSHCESPSHEWQDLLNPNKGGQQRPPL